jgi:hypothetical protein
MADELSIDKTAPEPTEARFTIRGLFVVMTAVAVVAAIAGIVIEHFPTETRSRVLAYWALWLLAVLGFIAVQFWRRRRAEVRAGATLLRVPPTHDERRVEWTLSFMMMALAIAYLMYGSTDALLNSKGGSGPALIGALGIMFLISAFGITQFVPVLLWQRELRFCRGGILWAQRCLPWDEVLEHRWTGPSREKLEIFNLNASKDAWLRVALPGERKAEIEAIIAGNVADIETAAVRTQAVGVGQVSIWAVFRTPHLRSHLWRVFTALSCGVALGVLVYARPTGMREFERGFQFAIVACCVLISWQWTWVGRNAGRVVVRVFARRDWIGFVVNAIGAVAVYVVADSFFWPWDWLGYPVGAVYSWFVVNVTVYFFVTQLDLRWNGVVMPRAFYWPWERITLIDWDRQTSGRLVLRRGWRRVYATVLPEQREAVDAVLRMKLGSKQETVAT